MSDKSTHNSESFDKDVDAEQNDNKRKRSELSSISSVSEHDKTVNTPDNKVKKKSKTGKKTKKSKTEKSDQEDNLDKIIDDFKKLDQEAEKMSGVSKQLQEMNAKLENVLKRDDPTLKKLIKEVFQEMKSDFLNSVFHRIELLEGKLHEKDDENDKLKSDIQDLEKKLVDQKAETDKAIGLVNVVDAKARETTNNLEQYSRKNNLRIDGVAETLNEDAEHTTAVVIDLLNKNVENLNLSRWDIDIAHRLGKPKGGKRQIIVKFVSRMTRQRVMRDKKNFKGTNIFINEDLTRLNQRVLSSLRKKAPEEIESAWTRDGLLMFKNKHDKSVKQLEFKEYKHWLSLKWPGEETSNIEMETNTTKM